MGRKLKSPPSPPPSPFPMIDWSRTTRKVGWFGIINSRARNYETHRPCVRPKDYSRNLSHAHHLKYGGLYRKINREYTRISRPRPFKRKYFNQNIWGFCPKLLPGISVNSKLSKLHHVSGLLLSWKPSFSLQRWFSMLFPPFQASTKVRLIRLICLAQNLNKYTGFSMYLFI